MNIYEVLEEIEKAYPEDIFPDTTQGMRDDVVARYPGFIDRTSAMMGRHLAKVIRQRLDKKIELNNIIVSWDNEFGIEVKQLQKYLRGKKGFVIVEIRQGDLAVAHLGEP